MLSSHLRLGLPSDLFPTGFPTKTLYIHLLTPIRATCRAHLDLITRIIFVEEYRPLSSSLCSLRYSPLTSSHLSPNIFLSTLFSNILSLRSSLNVSDQVSHPYKTTGRIVVRYILIFIFSVSKVEEKRSCTELRQAFHDFSLLLIYSWIEFWFVRVLTKCLKCSTLS